MPTRTVLSYEVYVASAMDSPPDGDRASVTLTFCNSNGTSTRPDPLTDEFVGAVAQFCAGWDGIEFVNVVKHEVAYTDDYNAVEL